jgi:hypothetical protein
MGEVMGRKTPYRDKTPPTHLRSLFRYLFWSGKTKRDLASSLPRVATGRASHLSRSLKREEIERLIDAVWAPDAVGRRNYAMLMVLARLGLRAPEVIAIQLDDIDWRAGTILIRGKGKRHDRMPLPEDAGKAIVNYIRNGRRGSSRTLSDAPTAAEAVQRPTMKFVATKTVEQLDLQALHRVRERLVGQRTGIINQIRAFLLERGVAVRQGLRFLRAELPGILATRTDTLSPRMVRVIEDLASDWHRLDERIEGLSTEIGALAGQDPACMRLMTVPGIGPIISSAMVAAIGTGEVFSKGRDFGAWLGLVPKQISTGDRTILGKISRRGNRGGHGEPRRQQISPASWHRRAHAPPVSSRCLARMPRREGRRS